MNAIDIKPAVREKTNVLISLAGPSGCGKTYSALLMARGLAGPDGKIGAIDTEAKRMRHYADLTPFDVADLAPPFTPLRYLEYVRAFADAGYKVLVIDSISHEWEGTGGCCEMAEGGKGLLAWQRPKADHKKLMNYLLQVPMHVIFCARAREKMVQIKNPQTGRDEVINQGWHAIAEKNFIFEMTVSMILDEQTKIPTLTKCPAQLLHAFPDGLKITKESGAALKDWAEQGADVDQAFEMLKSDGREVAMLGMDQLKKWFAGLSKLEQGMVKPVLDSELKSIAHDAARNVQPEEDNAFEPVNGIAQEHDDPAEDDIEAAVEYMGLAAAKIEGFTNAKALINWFNTEFKAEADKHHLSPGQIEKIARDRDQKIKTFR